MTTITDTTTNSYYNGAVFVNEERDVVEVKYQKMYTEKHKQDMDFVIIGERYIGPFIDMNTAQKAAQAINEQLSPKPKPRTRTEYVKVTESIFDLKEEFERGELYESVCGGKLENEHDFIHAYTHGHLVRKVEKEIDWRKEVIDYLGGLDEGEFDFSAKLSEDLSEQLDDMIWCNVTEKDFLKLCRVALRANGEIE